jgi:hypothetical protein
LTCSLRPSTAKSARPQVELSRRPWALCRLLLCGLSPLRIGHGHRQAEPGTFDLRYPEPGPSLRPSLLTPIASTRPWSVVPESPNAPDHALHVTSGALPRRHSPPTQRRNSHAVVQPAAGANNPNASLQRTGADQISGTKKGDRSRPFSGLTELSSVFPFAHGADHQWWSDRQLQLPACAFP